MVLFFLAAAASLCSSWQLRVASRTLGAGIAELVIFLVARCSTALRPEFLCGTGTHGVDGDALDVLVLTDEPLFPAVFGSGAAHRVIEAEQTQEVHSTDEPVA